MLKEKVAIFDQLANEKSKTEMPSFGSLNFVNQTETK